MGIRDGTTTTGAKSSNCRPQVLFPPSYEIKRPSYIVHRGKTLGGSSAINGLAFGRASSPEYDAWNTFAPNNGWTFKGLVPFFQKSENVALKPTNPYPGISAASAAKAASDNQHFEGFNGPVDVKLVSSIDFAFVAQWVLLQVSFNEIYPDVVTTYVKTINALGIGTNAEPVS